MFSFADFVKSIQIELRDVLAQIHSVSENITHVQNHVFKIRENFKILEEVTCEKSSSFAEAQLLNSDLQQACVQLNTMMMQLERTMQQSLGISGSRLDKIREKILNAGILFPETIIEGEPRHAIEELIKNLDRVCEAVNFMLKQQNEFWIIPKAPQ